MANIILEGEFTVADLQGFIAQGRKVHGIEAYVEIPVAKIKDKVKKADSFMIAEGHDINFENYTECKKSLDGTKAALKIGWESQSYKGKDISNVNFSEFDAYVKKFGWEAVKMPQDLIKNEYEKIDIPNNNTIEVTKTDAELLVENKILWLENLSLLTKKTEIEAFCIMHNFTGVYDSKLTVLQNKINIQAYIENL